MENSKRYVNCYIYVLEGISDWEIGYLISELNSKRYICNDINLKFEYISENLSPIKTMGGITVEPKLEISKIDFKEGDLLVLPGSDLWDKTSNNYLKENIGELNKKKVIIAAICGATFTIAKLGLLDQREHTSNDLEYLKFLCPSYSGSSFYSSKSVVVNNNLITATGIAPLEFTYEIFKIMNLMSNDTLDAWYQLYNTKNPKYYLTLMKTLQENNN